MDNREYPVDRTKQPVRSIAEAMDLFVNGWGAGNQYSIDYWQHMLEAVVQPAYKKAGVMLMYPAEETKCTNCNGRGYFPGEERDGATNPDCPVCDGTGEAYESE